MKNLLNILIAMGIVMLFSCNNPANTEDAATDATTVVEEEAEATEEAKCEEGKCEEGKCEEGKCEEGKCEEGAESTEEEAAN